MISLDGVLQAPGGPEEDLEGAFAYGGWTAPFNDEEFDKAMATELAEFDYLLGRKTFEIWENYWPEHGDFWPAINSGTKYVLSSTRNSSDWAHTEFVQTAEDIRKLKDSQGADLQVWGSSGLIQLLLQHDLVDEFRLKIYPLTLGSGKKLFGDGTVPAAFELMDGTITKSGIILANYKRAGEVRTGNVEI
jgi:dihydrofolate reductase